MGDESPVQAGIRAGRDYLDGHRGEAGAELRAIDIAALEAANATAGALALAPSHRAAVAGLDLAVAALARAGVPLPPGAVAALQVALSEIVELARGAAEPAAPVARKLETSDLRGLAERR